MSTKSHAGRSTGAILLEFLGSMNLAITLLSMVAISSVVGTVLKQNEPYQDYIIKFGSFWFEVFKALGLFDVYSAVWFLLILGFLLASTSVCVYRNGPSMLRDMRAFRENVAQNSLRHLQDKAEWQIARPVSIVAGAVSAHLGSYGYRIRPKEHPEHTVLAAMKGATNRLGYLLTHIGIVVICVGALLDGNMPLKLAELTGKIKVETRTLPTSQVPQASRLPLDNSSFRGLVSIPEGRVAKHVDVKLRDGYLLQELPFEVEVKDFRIEHYDNGQPKSFESDLVIYDQDLVRPLQKTIGVNHPLLYKGYAIYQANFSDGGSKLAMRAWPLAGTTTPLQVQGEVGKSLKLETVQDPLTVELMGFRLFNIKDAPPESGKKFKDVGPSFIFKLRNANGIALEYENYMAPVEQDGRLFFISGMRTNPNDDYRYLQIPADPKGGVERFMRFMSALRNEQSLQQAAAQVVRQTLEDDASLEVQQALTRVMQRMLDRFGEGGFEAVVEYLQANLPQAQRKEAATSYLELLRKALGVVYADILSKEGTQVASSIAEQQNGQFFEDAVNALGVVPQYGSPYYVQLTNFEHIQAAGLQITRAPGQNIVYLGFGMLIIGVFVMFYVPQRRLWAWIKQDADTTTILFAGTSNRDRIGGFASEFKALQEGLEARLKAL